MNVIDTNVWIYRHDSRDPQKQRLADQLITTVRPLLLLWQVGCEFIAASRKLASIGFSEGQAWASLADMQNLSVAVLFPDGQVWTEARALQRRHSLAFWDALLIAACRRGGARTLYTENIGAPRVIDGLSLVNPFQPGP